MFKKILAKKAINSHTFRFQVGTIDSISCGGRSALLAKAGLEPVEARSTTGGSGSYP